MSDGRELAEIIERQRENNDVLRTAMVLVLAAGGSLRVLPEHMEDVTSYRIVSEKEHDTMATLLRVERIKEPAPIYYGAAR